MLCDAIKTPIKSIGKAVLAILLLWQIAAVAHLVRVDHVYCAEHHVFEHVDSSGHSSDHNNGAPHNHDTDHDCFVVEALVAACATPAPSAPVVPIAEWVLIAPVPGQLETLVTSERQRFRLSPSLSPPSHLG